MKGQSQRKPSDLLNDVLFEDAKNNKEQNPLETQIGGSHYKDFKIQPVVFIEKNKLSFLEGNVIKRICRHANKNGLEDLRKAKHEIDLLIELYYTENKEV